MVEFIVGVPAEPSTHKTQYCDLRSITDPMYIGMGFRVFNYDSIGLYIQITGSGIDWTIGTTNFGILGSGSSFLKEITRFAEKAKRPSEGNDSVIITLNAYTDAGYSNLKWTYDKTVIIHFFDSTDPSWTTDELSDFDDFTTQGWNCFRTVACGYLGYCRANNLVFRSAPYSLQKYCDHTSTPSYEEGGFYKHFNIPDKDEVYALADLYIGIVSGTTNEEGLYIDVGNTAAPPDIPSNGVKFNYVRNDVPINKWLRLVAPLPPGEINLEVRFGYILHYGAYTNIRFHMDDFKIISRDN